MKLDPHKNKQRFDAWKEEADKIGIKGITKTNSKIVIAYLSDMHSGVNVARGSKRGARSDIRLNTLRVRIVQLIKFLEKEKIKDITKVNEKAVIKVFSDLSSGVIKKLNGQKYNSISDFVKDFRSFWGWLNLIKGGSLPDVTKYLDSKKPEPDFVYFTKEELEQLLPFFSEDEQVRMWFMFDSIIRSPTELMNVKVSDFHNNFTELSIRQETAKTFGRTIKILLCSEALREYVKKNKLQPDDFIFKFAPGKFNQKLRKVAKQIWGDKISKGGSPYKELTQYDFRHSGACFWRLGAYNSKIDALMYRGGWSNLVMLNYYTKKLGMKDSIERTDLLIEVDKNEMQKEIDELKAEMNSYKKAFNALALNVGIAK